jgi:hypothetical protein
MIPHIGNRVAIKLLCLLRVSESYIPALIACFTLSWSMAQPHQEPEQYFQFLILFKPAISLWMRQIFGWDLGKA